MAGANVTLGADPEMGFLDALGFIVDAKNILKFRTKDEGEQARFGCDGTDAIAELRPEPSRDPFQVVRNIRGDMADAISRHPGLGKVQWKAGTIVDSYTLGGHIHFGAWEYMPPANPPRGADHKNDITGTARMAVIEPVMNALLAVPCVLLEDPNEARQRRTQPPPRQPERPPYGTFNHRVVAWQAHGFEYRPLASWLTSPYVAAAHLCLAKAIMDDILDQKISHLNVNNLMADVQYDQKIVERYEDDKLREMFKRVWPQIQKLTRYEQYKSNIDFIKTLVDEHLSWYPKISMVEAWGLRPDLSPVHEASLSPMVSSNDVFADLIALADGGVQLHV